MEGSERPVRNVMSVYLVKMSTVFKLKEVRAYLPISPHIVIYMSRDLECR